MDRCASVDTGASHDDDLIAAAEREFSDLGGSSGWLAALRSTGSVPMPSADTFPGYEVVGELHRGGQGVVYLANQASTKRRVAIKVLRAGPHAGLRERLRFEREVEVLARLDHPGVVKILEAGCAAGCFYFVMDYIAGRPLSDWAAAWRASTRASSARPAKANVATPLRLFAQICDAVHAGHVRGVIHRDLKPANVLVVDELQSAIPKVLDFGLAKIETTEGTERNEERQLTMTGQFLGSLPWTSPEQVRGRVGEVDTRSDVYALGVVLFEMLTGRLPYSLVGNLRDDGDTILSAAPARLRSHDRAFDDELETIVQQCLAKDRERRYQSAGELGRDVRRYLQGEPIEAKRDSRWYMLKKMLERYRAAAGVAAAFVVLIAASLLAMTVLYRQAAMERERAVAAEHHATYERVLAEEQRRLAEERAAEAARARDEAVSARAAEAAQRQLAETRAQETQQVAKFQEEMLNRVNAESAKSASLINFLQEMLTSADPAKARGREISVREVLDEAAQRVDTQALPSEVEAKVRSALGQTYANLGQLDAAEPQLRTALDERRKSLGDEHPDVAAAEASLSDLLRQRGNLAEAEALARQALEVRRKVLGDAHPDTARSLVQLAEVLHLEGRLAEAEPPLREALAQQRRVLGDEHADVVATMANLANLLAGKGQPAEAEALVRQALATARRSLGDNHPQVATLTNQLAGLLSATGNDEQAEALLRETLEERRKILGEDHPQTLQTMNQLAASLVRQGKFDSAEPLVRETLERGRRVFGEQHPQVIGSLSVLGGCLTGLKRFDEAEGVLLTAVQSAAQALGEEHPQTAKIRTRLVTLYQAWGKPDAAAKFAPAPTQRDSGEEP